MGIVRSAVSCLPIHSTELNRQKVYISTLSPLIFLPDYFTDALKTHVSFAFGLKSKLSIFMFGLIFLKYIS